MRRVAGSHRSAPGRRGRSTVPFGGEGRPLARKPTPASTSKLSAAFEQVAGCGSSTSAAGTRSLVRVFVQQADRRQMSAPFPACIPGRAQDARDPGPRRRRPGTTSPLETLATHHVGEQIAPPGAPAMMSTKNSLPKKASRRSGQSATDAAPALRAAALRPGKQGKGFRRRHRVRHRSPLVPAAVYPGPDPGPGRRRRGGGHGSPLPRTFGGEGRGRHFFAGRGRGAAACSQANAHLQEPSSWRHSSKHGCQCRRIHRPRCICRDQGSCTNCLTAVQIWPQHRRVRRSLPPRPD
jgi:hypothetical protein